ncbi:MAG: hypothetical protein Q8T11_14145 [Elusimicrobiota bacterium]|nr:hypothetical protein [Elusimicrobiota bacterium]
MRSLREAEPVVPHIVVLAPAANGPSVPGAAAPVYFRPMIGWALAAAAGLPRGAIGVSGPASEAELADALRGFPGVRSYGSQASPRDAARAAAAAESAKRDVLVLDGARVLLAPADLETLLVRHAAGISLCTFLSSPDGSPAGAWCFRREALDADGELPCEPVALRDPEGALAITGLDSLAAAERLLQDRLNGELLRRGVLLADPRTTRVDPACRLAPGSVIEGGCDLVNTSIAAGARVEAFCRLTNADIGEESVVRLSSIVESSRLGKGCRVGPFATVAGSKLDDEASAGSYAELMNTTLGRGTQAGGHSYLWNCTVGQDVEIGRGFLSTGPGDARQTVIEDDAFIGAACHVVAAVTVGRGAFIATGTSITDDAPAGSFVISRGRQVVKTGHARSHAPRRRP